MEGTKKCDFAWNTKAKLHRYGIDTNGINRKLLAIYINTYTHAQGVREKRSDRRSDREKTRKTKQTVIFAS